MANRDAGRTEVIPSLARAEGPERGGECIDATEADGDDAAVQEGAAGGSEPTCEDVRVLLRLLLDRSSYVPPHL